MSDSSTAGIAEDDIAGLQASLDEEAAAEDAESGAGAAGDAEAAPATAGLGDYSADAAPVVDVGDLAADAAPVDVGDLAADYIEGLLDIADIDGDIDIEDAGGRTTLVVSGGGSKLRRLGTPEVVGALQELTRLAVQTRTGEFARLTLDIGGSRDQRSRELASLVEEAVAAFANGDTRFALDPMSSYERKIVHDLAAERGLDSHSEGDGGARHIVLTPA